VPRCAQPTVIERFRWGVSFELGLTQNAGALTFEILAMRWAGIALPRWLWPKLNARERAHAGRFAFDIEIRLPWSEPLIHYRGWVTPGCAKRTG
jgi:hypothetical protein